MLIYRFELPASLASIVGDVALVGFAEHQSRLLLIDSHDGQAVDHALSSGRIAFACNKVPPIYELIITSGYCNNQINIQRLIFLS